VIILGVTVIFRVLPLSNEYLFSAADQDTSVFSPLEQMLRQDPLAGAEQAPQPPLPVGQ
jgi:hypothetical protein